MLPMEVPKREPLLWFLVNPSINWNENVFEVSWKRQETKRHNSVCNWQWKNKLFRTYISKKHLKFEKISSETLFWSLIWSSRSTMKSSFGLFPVFCCSRNLVFWAFQVSKRFTCIYYKFLTNISWKKILTFIPSSLTVTIYACFPEKGPLRVHSRNFALIFRLIGSLFVAIWIWRIIVCFSSK